MPLILGPDQLRRAVPIERAIEALHEAFVLADLDGSRVRERIDLRDTAELLVMPAIDAEAMGVKLVTLERGNRQRSLPLLHGVYVLFSAESLAPLAIIDGPELTSLRTAAVSALATRYLARPDARHLVVFGAGVQARAHVDAMIAVRPIEVVGVVDPNPNRAEALVAYASRSGIEAYVASPKQVSEADIVCTCTTSHEPVFRGELLQTKAHVNAMGAYRPDMRELDGMLLAKATLVVESRSAALEEAGDLLLAIAEGHIGPEHIDGDLGDLVRGVPFPTGRITVFKSVGLALEDLAIAKAAVAEHVTYAASEVIGDGSLSTSV